MPHLEFHHRFSRACEGSRRTKQHVLNWLWLPAGTQGIGESTKESLSPGHCTAEALPGMRQLTTNPNRRAALGSSTSALLGQVQWLTLQGEPCTLSRFCDYLHIKRNVSREREEEKWLWKCLSSILDREHQYLRVVCLFTKIRNNGISKVPAFNTEENKRKKWKYSLKVELFHLEIFKWLI